MKISEIKGALPLSYQLKYYKKYPWLRAYYNSKKRCGQKFYENIKLLITKDDFKNLWFRDKAYLMKNPSIDRIDSDGNYTLKNSRYIELVENCRLAGYSKHRRFMSKKGPILKIKNGKIIDKYYTQEEAGQSVGVGRRSISKMLCGRKSHVKNYQWKYANT